MPDFGLLVPGAPGMAEALTDDVAMLRALLEAEVAWVQAQAHLGTVPPAQADLISQAAQNLADDSEITELAKQTAEAGALGGNPVIPLIGFLRVEAKAVAGDDSLTKVIHTGLTSQDVHDTALVLVLKKAGSQILAALDTAIGATAALAEQHRDTPLLARTLAQAAVPTTFGAKFAVWLTALAHTRANLATVLAGLPVSYGGAGGELGGYVQRAPDGDAFQLVQAWADQLGLIVTANPWHVTRLPFMEIASALAQLCAVTGHIANDVLQAARPGIYELAEPAAQGRGVSSSMAHKRNPVLSILLKRTAIAAPALLGQVYTAAGLAVDERPDGAWHAEWPALQQLARYGVSAANAAAELLSGLEVNTENAAANLAAALPDLTLELAQPPATTAELVTRALASVG